uniref:Uncharacterized protein LOC107261271 n=1 Tax=Rhizophora mucronata TaxID=61149 RepID=A0A2P2MKM0_RHIMU
MNLLQPLKPSTHHLYGSHQESKPKQNVEEKTTFLFIFVRKIAFLKTVIKASRYLQYPQFFSIANSTIKDMITYAVQIFLEEI